ncbi:MAG: NERD domain-containing protein, partial [Candidatus Tectomicrobia bacterium]
MAQPNMVSHRWVAIAASAYPWERAALSYVRERFPDQDPFRAWSNFEFVAEDGSINEVDLLVVSQYKIYLVEIKSRP